MSAKDILFGREAQSLVKEGVDKLANAVKATLGPRGRNVLIEKTFGAPVVTKDGVTVLLTLTYGIRHLLSVRVYMLAWF